MSAGRLPGRLHGKRALITGGGSGIGLAIAERFIAEGAVVAVSDRNPEVASAVEGIGARFDVCNVADAAAVEAWVTAVSEDLGGIDVVVANAGYELVADALELSIEDWDRHQDVMLRGVFVTCKAALPPMIEGGGGSIIAIGSNLAFAAIPRFTSYLAAKSGVIGLVRGLAVDFSERGIRVNALCPGPTLTPLIERQLVGHPDPDSLIALWAGDTILKRLGRPEEIAAGAVFLASDEASFVTGSSLMVDGGYTAL
jgi:NAD(P)-dependent dehydrogenase (short-subunit alcohol dehydrogenase family)